MTKIFAALPSANSITFCALEKTDEGIKQIPMSQDVIRFQNQTENQILQSVSEITGAYINEHQFNKIAIAKAGSSPQGKGASPTRVKMEAAMQLSAMAAGIDPVLIPPQTLAAYEKKIPAGIENEIGAELSSNDKRKAATVAMCELSKQ